MSDVRTGFVLGYHGCDASVAEAIFAGGSIKPSAEKYDWLGPGAYFWEGDPKRALEWAEDRVARGKFTNAAVVGAIIDLGHCLDLTKRSDLELLKDAFASLESAFRKAGEPLPENHDPKKGGTGDKLLRFRDCAVIEHLHQNIDAVAKEAAIKGDVPAVPSFDTVRGLFVEGGELYPGGGFHSRNHTQIAVRQEKSILGYFRPRN
ncbi:hypothetical protein RFN29_21710 [Mesorhizobium sp. VK22B]|uniref:DUF3990 domain-containing protein n=1 Tax=Mesorhizobium captivum TaxID=3072319 RepID=A0ABU4Z4L0_9HYPH|nr:hypothetical protein [Mesorhizobium sp. VK22B]MDX8494187.1 hypothetical protein [Mesorhizobium sp. VK22B]